MQNYNATAELAVRDPGPDMIESHLERLAAYNVAVSTSPRGWLEVVITLPATDFAQAVQTACAVIGKDSLVSLQVMDTDEFDARNGLAPLPELVSVTEAAELLGVSRQAVIDRIARHTLAATKVGREYVIPRHLIG